MLKLERGQKYSELTVEKIIELLHPEYLQNLNQAHKSLTSQNLDSNDYNHVVQKLEYAEKRIIEPLELSLKIMCFLMPFGITSSFTPNESSDIKKFKKLRYIQKIKDYYKYSILGVVFYIIGGIVLGLYF